MLPPNARADAEIRPPHPTGNGRPARRPSRSSRAVRAALLGGLLLGQLNGGCMERGELECEEAVARLDACCPGFDPTRFACIHDEDSGCIAITPDIDGDLSRAIRDASCSELEANGTCDWARTHTAGGPHLRSAGSAP